MSDTVSMRFVSRAIGWLGSNGVLVERILRDAGINRAELDDPTSRVPTEAFAAVWRSVSHTLSDEFFGLDTRRLKPGSFALICRSIGSDTLFGTALRHAVEAFSLLLDDTYGSVKHDGRSASIQIVSTVRDPLQRMHAIELYVTMLHGVMCLTAGRRVPMIQLELDYLRPEHADEYRRMFTHCATFGACRTALHFDPSWMNASVAHLAERLNSFLDAMPKSVITKFEDQSRFALRIRRLLESCDPASWPDLSALASRLHMSSSTLQRRLEEEGSSYSMVKADLRRDLAIRLLKRTRKPIRDIAFEVGYQEFSTFCRAFRHWTGMPPRSFRQVRATQENRTAG